MCCNGTPDVSKQSSDFNPLNFLKVLDRLEDNDHSVSSGINSNQDYCDANSTTSVAGNYCTPPHSVRCSYDNEHQRVGYQELRTCPPYLYVRESKVPKGVHEPYNDSFINSFCEDSCDIFLKPLVCNDGENHAPKSCRDSEDRLPDMTVPFMLQNEERSSLLDPYHIETIRQFLDKKSKALSSLYNGNSEQVSYL